MKAGFSGIPFAVTILLLFLCIPVSAKEKQIVVDGFIYSAETNQPVQNAAIQFRREFPKKPRIALSKTTDVTGKFQVSLVEGTYRYTITSPGFAVYYGTVGLAGTDPVKFSIPLNREGMISGRIVDPQGKPLPGISVAIGKGLTGKTDAIGIFQIRGVDARGYEVRIGQRGWVAEKTLFISLGAGEKRELGDITVRRSGTLAVRLVAGDKEKGSRTSIGRAEVWLSGGPAYRSGRTSEKGDIVFAGLPPGFYSIGSYDDRIADPQMNVEVKEGERSAITIEAALRPPSLSFEYAERVFLPANPKKLRLRGLWIDKARITVYAVDSAAFREGSIDTDKPETIPIASLSREHTFSVPLKAQRGIHSKTAVFPLPPLRPGIYVVEAASGKTAARATFLVTRLGIVAKAAPSGTLLYAVDLVDGKAMEGVSVTAFPRSPDGSAGPEFTAVTDANGLAEYAGPGQPVRIIAFKDGHSSSISLARHHDRDATDRLRGYLYTDRPVYRPGQQVSFKGILRKRAGDEYALPGIDKVRVSIEDNDGQPVFEKDCTLNASGSFHGEFGLPGGPSLGTYTLKAEAKQETWQTYFKVLEYRKPEFEVSLTAAHKFRVGGDAEELQLLAQYYFGAPVAGAKIRYRIYSQPSPTTFPGSGDPTEGAYGEEENYYSGAYSDFLGEGEATSDENGRVKITVPTKQTVIPLIYTIEADVTDPASRQVSASADFLVTPSLVALDVASHGYLVRPGRPQKFSARTRTWDDKPVRSRVSVTIDEQYLDKRTRITKFRTIDTLGIETDASGQAEFLYSFPHPGYWRVAATAVDEQGRKTVVPEWVWVWQEGYAWDSSYRELGLESEKKSYKPGETARMIVKNPASGASLLVTLEGREIYSRRVIGPAGSVEVVEIPVLKEYAPYIYVSATAVSGGRFYTRTKMLRVDYQPGQLDVSIKTDKPVYAPGETVRLSLAAKGTADPAPRPAELSIAVVDEAIFAISPERREDIYPFFRGKREHLVLTLNSFPRVYLGGGAKDRISGIASEDRQQGLRVRKTFKDTAFWMPVVETDARGNATAEFVLPDNLTSWRATAVGHSDASDFGTGRGKFISRLDVMARLQPPRYFIQGDELRIPGMISNMTAKETGVVGRFEAEGLALGGDAAFSGKIAAGGTLRRDIHVKAGNPGMPLLRLRASAGENGDAMELQIPVLPRAIKRESLGNLVLRDTVGEATVELPDEALTEGSSLNVTLAPTLATSLQESLAALVDFPYGCVEQTMSRFLPAVYVRNLISSGRVSLEKEVSDRLPGVLDEGLKRLYDFQHEDGGWGWWKEGNSDPHMTAYVVYGLALSHRSGVTVRKEVLDRGENALRELMRKAAVGSLPFAYRSFTLSGKTDESVEKKIEAAWRQLRPSERIYYIDALLNGGQKQRANSFLAGLKENVKREGSAAYLQDEDALSWWYSWRWSASPVETTAMLLETVLASDPADPLAPPLAEFLVRKRSGRWWNTTRGTALVVKALADYVAATGESKASCTARLTLNGKELEQITVEKGKITKGSTSLAIPGSTLKRGANSLQLAKSGPEGALYLTAVLDYLVPPESGSQSPGLVLERKLYRINAHKDGNEWRLEYIPIQPGATLSPGDDIEVRLVVDNRENMNFVIIEDRLPAGFEVREAKTDLRFAGHGEFWNWYVHAERHDERMAFFLDNLPAGRHEFRYVMRPELEGTALALPASVWPMYVPSIKSESRPWEVTVTP